MQGKQNNNMPQQKVQEMQDPLAGTSRKTIHSNDSYLGLKNLSHRQCLTRKSETLAKNDNKMREKALQIKTLLQKVKRQQTRIKKLKSQINLIRNYTSQSEIENIVQGNFAKLRKVFCKVTPKVRQYSEEVKAFATNLHFYSPLAYEFVRTMISLPSLETLRRHDMQTNEKTQETHQINECNSVDDNHTVPYEEYLDINESDDDSTNMHMNELDEECEDIQLNETDDDSEDVKNNKT